MTSQSIGDLSSFIPDTSTSLPVEGIDAAVEIYRDPYGIPHVSAETVHDAFFGQGFATAQDRLWHMDFDRHCAYGRWAEYIGESGVEQDKTMRRFQIKASVKSDYEAINAETKSMADAYTAGINAFLKSTDRLPLEYSLIEIRPEQWMPWDCFAVYKVRHIMMGLFEGKLWRAKLVNILGPERAAELLCGYQPGHLIIVPPGHEYDGDCLNGFTELSEGLPGIEWMKEDVNAGSNSWAVHGSRTASGKPLLAGDSHRRLDTPNVYYQNRIACPEFDVIGLSFPGCPGFPHFGHNAHVAWCVTHTQADYQDLYVERFSPDDPLKYEYQGEWIPVEIRRELIKIKDNPSLEIDIPVTRHGPVIIENSEEKYGIAFKYSATAGPNLGFECFLPMLQASSAAELDATMEKWVDPCNNFVFVDEHGDIGYLNRGEVPIRSMANAWLPVPGWTGEHEWQGNIPFDHLARMRNPDSGFIVTANNRVLGKDYPYYIGLNFVPEYRARRIYERLKDMPAATVEDMGSVHMERISTPGKILTGLLSEIEIETADDLKAEAKRILIEWDGGMDRDQVAPTIYATTRIHLMRKIVNHLMGPVSEEMFTSTGRGAPRHLSELMSVLVTHARDNDTSLLPPGTGWPNLLSEALSDAVDYLRTRLGDNLHEWRWGKIHRTNPRHPLSDTNIDHSRDLDPPTFPMHGDADTPLQGGYSPGNPFEVTLLSVVRYVFDTSDWDNSRWAIPLGSSGHPGSPHYADQAYLWSDGELVPMFYNWEKVKSTAESYQKIEPHK